MSEGGKRLLQAANEMLGFARGELGAVMLVCGGRDYADRTRLRAELDALREARSVGVLVQGGAPGADRLAAQWARSRKVGVVTCLADWQRYGAAAGPIRNRKMLKETRPDLVVAFPGGDGTADMVRQAKAAGVEVIEVPPSPLVIV